MKRNTKKYAIRNKKGTGEKLWRDFCGGEELPAADGADQERGIKVMEMNFFRQLFGRRGECLVHFGEWRDTNTGETFRILYVSGKQELVNQRKVKSGHTLFLCPKTVDVLVLGEKNETVLTEVREMLEETAVGTVVCPGECELQELLKTKGTEGAEKEEKEEEKEDNGCRETVGRIISLHSGTNENELSMSVVGWEFSILCCEGRSTEEEVLTLLYRPEQEQMRLYEDCVMRVKNVSGACHCTVTETPDAYGCALGCSRQEDYDVCGCRRSEMALACLLGTALFPMSGISNRFRSEEGKRLLRIARKVCADSRFFVVTDTAWELLCESGGIYGQTELPAEEMPAKEIPAKKISAKEIPMKEISAEEVSAKEKTAIENTTEEGTAERRTAGQRRYFISMSDGLDGIALREICSGGFAARAMLLPDGSGICCSGFLKYTDEN